LLITLEDVENVDDLIDNLEKIEPPDQTGSALEDPLFQKYLSLRPTNELNTRLEFWLAQCFDEIIEQTSYGDGSASASEQEVLNALLIYAKRIKASLVLPP
jgi:centromere protein I